MDRITKLALALVVIANYTHGNNVVELRSSRGRFLFHASVQNSSNHHICNGVILDKNFILTSAQCVSNHSVSELKVFYGSDRLEGDDGLFIDVKEINIHPDFNQTTIKSDIALLFTRTNINFTGNLSRPINLPQHNVPVNEVLTGCGWKLHSENETDSLQCISGSPIRFDECRKLNPSLNHIIRTWLICSADLIQPTDVGSGGLGSALFAADNNTLYGIHTMNEQTVNTSSALYTNVFEHITWIRFILNGWPW